MFYITTDLCHHHTCVPLQNAFLYPNDPEAVFPKTQLRQPLDFRSEALPLSGYAASGCRRKYNDEEKLRLNLVLRSMDGCPDLEKRQLMEEQQRSYDLMPLEDVYAGEMLATEENPVTFEDETALISSIGNIGLSAVSESQTRGSDLEYLKAHQQRVGGRAKGSHHEKPVVKNFLKTRKGGKS